MKTPSSSVERIRIVGKSVLGSASSLLIRRQVEFAQSSTLSDRATWDRWIVEIQLGYRDCLDWLIDEMFKNDITLL